MARGYNSFICISERSREREEAGLRALFDHLVNGVIVATRETDAGNELLTRLKRRDLPLVVIGRDFKHAQVDRVWLKQAFICCPRQSLENSCRNLSWRSPSNCPPSESIWRVS